MDIHLNTIKRQSTKIPQKLKHEIQKHLNTIMYGK